MIVDSLCPIPVNKQFYFYNLSCHPSTLSFPININFSGSFKEPLFHLESVWHNKLTLWTAKFYCDSNHNYGISHSHSCKGEIHHGNQCIYNVVVALGYKKNVNPKTINIDTGLTYLLPSKSIITYQTNSSIHKLLLDTLIWLDC